MTRFRLHPRPRHALVIDGPFQGVKLALRPLARSQLYFGVIVDGDMAGRWVMLPPRVVREIREPGRRREVVRYAVPHT